LKIVRVIDALRNKNIDRWLAGYGKHLVRARLDGRPRGTRHLLFALCDHYEPLWRGADEAVGRARVRAWLNRYPALADRYRDADGRPPQHSFFFPGEEYRPGFFDDIDELARRGYGEVELHLHHDGDTAHSLRAAIEHYLAVYSARGHLSQKNGPRYAFIHGNWALANARPDGRWCGVDDELPLLFDTGCYADFTFPSVPDVSQPNIVNQIYWPVGHLGRKRAYEQGERTRVGHVYLDRLVMIQGPLAVTRRSGRLRPRLEYGAVTAHDPANRARVDSWVQQNIHVEGRPEWVFVKVYTHGAGETQARSLLGQGGRALHQALARYNDGRRWKLHYVTAREMYNIAMAAAYGETGNPNDYRDYVLRPPPIRERTPIRRPTRQ
jgi:hypothetical protein